MSFDRVLPRPPALNDEPAGRVHRPTSNLLEHKIMNDYHHHNQNSHGLASPISRPNSVYRHHAEPASCATALSQMQRSSFNQDKVVQNDIPASIGTTARQATPVLTIEVSQARSASVSPIKPESGKELATHFCLCQPDPKIPRPRNAFILYRQHYQASVVAQNPGLANPEISKIIGEQWRALPNETKDEWKALAEAEKARHQQQYPDYRYQPRRFGRDSTSRHATISSAHPGATVCNRCGGRLMNPPLSPNTPLTLTGRNSSCRSSQTDSSSSNHDPSRGAGDVSTHPSSQAQLRVETNRKASRQHHWKDVDCPSDVKRRRLATHEIHRGSIQGGSPFTEPYSLSSQKTYVSRPGVAYFRSHCETPTAARNHPRHEEDRFYDSNLTLPPLKTGTVSPVQQDLEAMVMTIPVLNKIKVLAKISPPISNNFMGKNSIARGAVIAVDGQDPTLVNIMLKYLGTLLTKNVKYVVRVFEGPDPRPRRNSSKVGDATVDYLNVISAWHRISDEIVQFVSPKFGHNGTRPVDDYTSAVSPKSTVLKSSWPSPMQSTANGSAHEMGHGLAPPTGKPSSPMPIALVPRYQLTTADMFTCSVPIVDRYAPLDHWQWMASLWRACVGPDVTIHIRECDREELDRHGAGNPVEVRLNDARTLVIRRTPDSLKEIDEKALRRVAFEIEDFLTH